MVYFPPAKINLGLNIIGKRPDGYHNLETFFYPISLCDGLEIIPEPDSEIPKFGSIRFSSSGLEISGNPAENLCVKAYHLLFIDFPQLPSVQLHLHKNIPMGAGLGGGSSDCASTLLALNQQFLLGISTQKLIDYAAQLGSDCAFFILNEPCFANGRGEILEPIALNLAGKYLVLVHPGIHVSTKQAFAGVIPNNLAVSIKTVLQKPITEWRNLLVNDFEGSVFTAQPILKAIKEALYEHGAVYASMTGSGSSIYGIFNEAPTFTSLPNHALRTDILAL